VINGFTSTLTATAAVKQQEISFARSFGVPNALVPAAAPDNHLSYIPQAQDAVGVAERVNGTAQVAANLGGGACGGAAQCYPWLVTSVSRTGAAVSFPVVPVLPEASAGIRSFFLTAINAVLRRAGHRAESRPGRLQHDSRYHLPDDQRPLAVRRCGH
jgi:hypothetical protein